MPRGGRLPPGPLARWGLTAGLALLLCLGLPQVDLRLLADPARAVALRQPEALLLALIAIVCIVAVTSGPVAIHAPPWITSMVGRACAAGTQTRKARRTVSNRTHQA